LGHRRRAGSLRRDDEAILDDNPGREVEVGDKGSYVRVQASGFMRVTLASLRRNVGATFEMRQLEAMLSAFAGRIRTSSDEITWTLTTEPAEPPKEAR
jgi:toluene monooxygenase system protein D